MLGERLLASKAYGHCSKNDTNIKELFESTSFWNTTCIKDIAGAPGLSSGVFDGKILQSQQNDLHARKTHLPFHGQLPLTPGEVVIEIIHIEQVT